MHLTVPQMVVMFRGRQKMELTGGIGIGSAVASLVASLVEEKVLERLKGAMGAKLPYMKAYIDNVFFACRARDAKEIVNALETLGKPYGLIYAFRESHPHKIYFAEKRTKDPYEWREQFPGWEVTAFAQLHDGKGKVPPSAMGQGIKLAGVPLGSPRHYNTVMWEKVVKQLAKVDVLSKHASPQEFLVLLRSSVIPGLDYLRRLVPADAARMYTEFFDTQVLMKLQAKMDGAGDWSQGVCRKWLHTLRSGVRRLESSNEAACIASAVSAYRSGGIGAKGLRRKYSSF
jgi:hypothetical protein